MLPSHARPQYGVLGLAAATTPAWRLRHPRKPPCRPITHTRPPDTCSSDPRPIRGSQKPPTPTDTRPRVNPARLLDRPRPSPAPDCSTLPALRSVRCPSRPSRPSAPFPLDHGQGTGQPAQPCTRPSRGDDSCRWVTITGRRVTIARHGVTIAGDDSTGGKDDDSDVTIRGRVIDG